MQLTEMHPTMRQAIGCFEGFRKLGFPSKEIFVNFREPDKMMLVVLQTQDKQFAVSVGTIDVAPAEFDRQWIEVAEAVNGGQVSQEDLDTIWQESLPCRESTAFLVALLGKGIKVLKGLN